MAAESERDATREMRLRRMAERQGLRLIKSRRRDPYALDFGMWWLVPTSHATDPSKLTHRTGLTIDQVEERLTHRHAST